MTGEPTGAADARTGSARPARAVGAKRWRVAVVSGAVVLLVAGLVLVIAPPLSRPMAGRLAEDWLRSHGADASVEVTALSADALSARVRLGDRRDPDLTIDRLEVTYALSGPWTAHAFVLTPKTVRLVRPRLRARVLNGSVDVGQLAGLIDWARRQPPTRQPLPDITIVDGQARLATPGGTLLITGNGDYADRRALAFYGGLAPFRQVLGGVTVSGDGGVLEIVRRGPRLGARAELGLTRLDHGQDSVRAASLTLRSDVPWPDRPERLAGPASVRLSAQGLAGGWGGSRLADSAVSLAFSGVVEATSARQRVAGALIAAVRAAGVEGAGMRAAGLAADAALPGLDLVDDAGRLSARGPGTLTLSLNQITAPDGAGSGLSAAASLSDGALGLDRGAWTGHAVLVGRAYGRGGLAPRLVRGLITGLPTGPVARRYSEALGAALKDVRFAAPQWRLNLDSRRARFALVAPARLDAASGAAMVLSGEGELSGGQNWRATGEGAVSMTGGGLPTLSLTATDLAAGPAGLQTTLRGHGSLDADFVKGADLTFDTRLAMTRTRLRVDLLQCAPVKAERLASGPDVAQRVSLRLCPTADPLIEASIGRWRAAGRLEGLSGDDADLALGLRKTDVAFDIVGGNAGLGEARLTLASAALLDLSDATRFRPLTLEGDLHGDPQGAGGAWRGAFAVRDGAQRELIRLTVAASPGGAGRLDFDTGELTFAPGGLQPVDLTPLAAGARNVSGQVAFKGWLSWGGAGQDRSGGELIVRDLGLTGPTGPVSKVDARIAFTSLLPAVTAPDQQITVARIATITPMTNLDVVFELQAGALDLRHAQGDLAGGQVSLSPTTVDLHPGSRFSGVLTLHRVDLGEVLAATSLAEQVKLQAVVDGQVPFSVEPSGVEIREGVLSAVGGGRLSISRTALGAPPAGATGAGGSSADAGVAQDFAYQALDNLAFDTLDARLNTLPKDRLGVIFHIKGRHDPPQRRQALIRFADVMRGRALTRPIDLPSDTKIDLTLDTSLNFGELVQALAAAWQDAIRPASNHSEGAAPGSQAPAAGESRHP